jgi:hexulose-6-phosphate isomerase
MLLASHLVKVHDAYGLKGTVDILKKAGFDAIDFSLDIEEYYTNEYDDWFFTEARKYIEEKGMTVCQAHAPFPTSFLDEEENERRFDVIVRSMRFASLLGAPMIVIHPCMHLSLTEEGNFDRMFEYNLAFYRRLIPYAEKFGIKIALENIPTTITAKPSGLAKLYDTLDHPVFTICLDTGHFIVPSVNEDLCEAIRLLGARLADGCTHIHDNFGNWDMHTCPFHGKIDWESVMKALSDIGYRGNFDNEAFLFMHTLPSELYPAALTYMASVGKYLIGRFEYHQKNK